MDATQDYGFNPQQFLGRPSHQQSVGVLAQEDLEARRCVPSREQTEQQVLVPRRQTFKPEFLFQRNESLISEEHQTIHGQTVQGQTSQIQNQHKPFIEID